MTSREKRNDLDGCLVRYKKKWEAIKIIKEIKDSYINTGPDSYKNWDKWMQVEKELREL